MTKNPFKFGTIVEEEFFTDRYQELPRIVHMTNSENHLVLIRPRRFGKSSWVVKAIKQLDQPGVPRKLEGHQRHGLGTSQKRKAQKAQSTKHIFYI